MSRKWFITASAGAALLAASVLAGSATSAPAKHQRAAGGITLGFSQVGSESGWRTANTKSVQSSAKDAGISLKFSDAQQKQENQIAAIRSYIQQQVERDRVLARRRERLGRRPQRGEARRIPVILTDRAVDSKDKSLYKTFLGSDFVKEGRLVGQWVANNYKGATKDVNIVELQGTTGSAPAIDRAAGFRAAIKGNPHLKIIASQTGEFTRAKGKEVMAAFLKANPNIDLLFAHNDDMGLGAIEAIEEAGLKPGKDIKIVTIDAVHDGMVALLARGRSTSSRSAARCSGRSSWTLVKKVVAGQAVPKRIVTKETTFTPAQAKAALPTRKY